MINIVLDTNVFMSGLFWAGTPGKILDAWKNNKLKIVFSREILEEYIRVGDILRRKYPGVNVGPFIELITLHGEFHASKSLPTPVSQDPDDDKFLAVALEANCKLIISGDKDLLNVNGYANIEILKPSEFLSKYLQEVPAY